MKLIQIHEEKDLQQRMTLVWNIACEMIKEAPIMIEIKRVSKTRLQEKKYHSMIGDIAKQVTFDGNKRYPVDVWKARLIEQFSKDKEEMGERLTHPGTCVVSLDGQRLITVRPSSKQFNKKEAAEFIEYLYSQGCEMGVKFCETNLKYYQEWSEKNGIH